MGIINKLRNKNEHLESKLHEQAQSMKKYAYEYYLLGNECITKAHDAKSALANFDKALSLDPLLVDAWIRKGITLMDMNEDNEAARCFNEAVRLSPRYFKALYNRGKLRYKTGDYEIAISDLLKASDLKPHNPTVHDRLGDAYSKIGNMEQATRQWLIAETIREQKSK